MSLRFATHSVHPHRRGNNRDYSGKMGAQQVCDALLLVFSDRLTYDEPSSDVEWDTNVEGSV